MWKNESGELTVKAARALLSKNPLRFGNPEQMEAVHVIELYEEAMSYGMTIASDCGVCDGSGETECPHCDQDMTCHCCGGTGEYSEELTELMGSTAIRSYIASAREVEPVRGAVLLLTEALAIDCVR